MASHIRTFGAHFHVSGMFLFLVLNDLKLLVSPMYISPRTCGAENFVVDVTLVYFFRTKFESREFLSECF